MTEQKDQIAITKAETEYEQALSDIEAKDKQLDVQMKNLIQSTMPFKQNMTA